MQWAFRTDPNDAGVEQHWFESPAARENWSPINVGKFWEEQGWDYDGFGWYRTHFEMPDPPGGKLHLAFGACDESATVWLNGQKVGAHDLGEYGWDRPFSIDVSGVLRKGSNTLCVRVLNRAGPGGIWKPVMLLRGDVAPDHPDH